MDKIIQRTCAIVFVSLLVTVTLYVTLAGTSVMALRMPRSEATDSLAAEGQPEPDKNPIACVVLDEIMLQAESTETKVLVDEVPADAVVAGIDLKVFIEGVPAPALETHVSAPGTKMIKLPLSLSAVGGVARTAETAHELDGSSAQGVWTVMLVPMDAALEGHRASISLAIHYTATLPLPEIRSGGEGARPAFHRLPAPVWELASPSGENQLK